MLPSLTIIVFCLGDSSPNLPMMPTSPPDFSSLRRSPRIAKNSSEQTSQNSPGILNQKKSSFSIFPTQKSSVGLGSEEKLTSETLEKSSETVPGMSSKSSGGRSVSLDPYPLSESCKKFFIFRFNIY